MKANMLANQTASALMIVLLLAGFLLTGCSALGESTPQVLPTVVLESGGTEANPPVLVDGSQPGSGVAASGVIVPAEKAQIAFTTGGNIKTVHVFNGDQVQAGQVLVSLAGSEKMIAAVKAANLEMLSAQQALNSLAEGAGQARAQAMLRLAQAKDALDTAEQRRGWKEYRVGDDNQIDVARADLIVAEDTLKKAEEVYGGFADSPDDNLNKAAALSAIAAARKARDKAQANLNYLLSLPQELDVAKADAELEVARAEVEAAQREYEKVKDGVSADALALAQARVDNARAQLEASQAALADLELKAPFAGTVSSLSVHNGEWVLPGQEILVLASLNDLRVETTDLSERDVPKVTIGQPVTVLIKALNQTVPGRVSDLAALSETLGGDVVYKSTITLDTLPPGLRSGMSVEVQFESLP